jgi:hypothetical protein
MLDLTQISRSDALSLTGVLAAARHHHGGPHAILTNTDAAGFLFRTKVSACYWQSIADACVAMTTLRSVPALCWAQPRRL